MEPLCYGVLLLLLATATNAYTCTSDADCELLGTCNTANGTCACFAGFTGDSCGSVSFKPIASQRPEDYMVYPSPSAAAIDNISFSWGFTALWDDETNAYHAIVNTGCCSETTCGVTVNGTLLVHVTAPSPTGPWARVGVAAPPTTFNPHLMREPSTGRILLYFRVNELDQARACLGDGTTVDNSSTLSPYVNRESLDADPTEEGPTNMYVAWSDSFTSQSWQVKKLKFIHPPAAHLSNPSVAASADGSGRMLMAFRYDRGSENDEANGFAWAASFDGPFHCSANLSYTSGNDEDPYIFQLPGRPATEWHILYHNGRHGLHAFSSDDGGNWSKTKINGTDAFTLDVALEEMGGEVYSFSRRERPEILFDSSGKPAFLLNGVNTKGPTLPSGGSADSNGFSRAFSFIQAIDS
eukprot:TRINITY_DN1720_c0_g1_i1.p1 TRINITY_DN1720_c0_g1~~TRINITY_DN1720_c0_g1_i1.p1  ORF type:complete len:411 (-),score=54.34 TRINITY_DN1720_c0_g1_i1:39-1271(-)